MSVTWSPWFHKNNVFQRLFHPQGSRLLSWGHLELLRFLYLIGESCCFPLHRQCQPDQIFDICNIQMWVHINLTFIVYTLLLRDRLTTVHWLSSNNQNFSSFSNFIVSIIQLIFNVLVYDQSVPRHFVSITRLSVFVIGDLYCI